LVSSRLFFSFFFSFFFVFFFFFFFSLSFLPSFLSSFFLFRLGMVFYYYYYFISNQNQIKGELGSGCNTWLHHISLKPTQPLISCYQFDKKPGTQEKPLTII